jgi:hypothetical protein
VTPLFNAQSLLDVGPIVSPSTSEQHVAQTYLPFLLDPFRAEMKDILQGASKENKDALERYRTGRVLFASLKTNHVDHPPKSALGLSLPPSTAIRKNSDENSRSPPINREREPPGSGTPSPRDLKKSRRQTPNNLEGMFRRFSVEVDAREGGISQQTPHQSQLGPGQPSTPQSSTTSIEVPTVGPVKIIGFNAPPPPTSPQPLVVVGFSVPSSSAPPPPTATTTLSPRIPPLHVKAGGSRKQNSNHIGTIYSPSPSSGSSSSASSTSTGSSSSASTSSTTSSSSSSSSASSTTPQSSTATPKSPRGGGDDEGVGGKVVRVFFTDGSSRGLHVLENENVGSLIRRLLRKFNIPPNQTHLWRLYERIESTSPSPFFPFHSFLLFRPLSQLLCSDSCSLYHLEADRPLPEDEIVLPLYESLQSATNLFSTPDNQRCIILKSIQEEVRLFHPFAFRLHLPSSHTFPAFSHEKIRRKTRMGTMDH